LVENYFIILKYWESWHAFIHMTSLASSHLRQRESTAQKAAKAQYKRIGKRS